MQKRFVVLALLVAPALFAQPLKVVTVGAPAVNKVFNPSGIIPVQDFSSPIYTSGFLQSRNFQGASGAPAAGLYVYEYRVDLRNVVGITFIPAITKLTVNFGPNVPLDFNGDKKLDDVFVVTKGGLGNVGLVSAVRVGNLITFTFAGGGVAGGSSPGKGDSSFFFGVVSKQPRHTISVAATAAPPPNLTLQAWAPGAARTTAVLLRDRSNDFVEAPR
jgi:hypothetical protein